MSTDDVVRVDFDFRSELTEKLEGNLVAYCYQCGACVGDCPAATYGKGFNPREIMLQVLYGQEEALLGEESVLWDCTNCYACYERCPQGVKPVEIIISLKSMLADRQKMPKPVQAVIRTFEETGRTVPLSAAVTRNRAKWDLPVLSEIPMDDITALLQPDEPGAVPSTTELAPEVGEPGEPIQQAAPEGRYAFFPGCLIPTRYSAMEKAIRRTLANLDIELVDLDGASCCPDPIYFKSKDKIAWLSVAARNLVLAEERGLDVVANCSGCTATLSEAHHHLEDPILRAQVNARLARIGLTYRGTSRVRHIATLLRDQIGYDKIAASVTRPLDGLKVAIHYGCHLLKPSDVMNVDDPDNPQMLENLVKALGGKPVRHRNWSLCCGKACLDADLPDTMLRDLLGTVQEEEADLFCLVCPTCFGQFDNGQVRLSRKFEETFDTPTVYYFQLLAFAQGVPYDQLGFDRQRIKPEVLSKL